LARNTLYSALSSASNGLMLVLVIAAARVLGDKIFGEFSFALALASIFEMLIDMGLTTLTTRNVSRDRRLTSPYLSNILGWKIALSAAAMGLLVLTVNIMHQSEEARIAAYIIGAGIVLRSYKSTSVAIFQAHERFDLILLVMYIERAGLLTFCLASLYFSKSLIVFSIVFSLVRIPDTIFAYWLVHRKIVPVGIGFDRSIIKRLQISAIPFGSYSIIAMIYAYTGTLVLSATRPPEQVGWYSAGLKVYEGLAMFPYLLSAVLLPRLSKLFTADRAHHASLSAKAIRYISLGSLPMAVSIGVLAPRILALMYGAEYLPAVTALRILLAASILMFANTLLNTILISANMETYMLRVAAAGLVVMAASNLILVRPLGAIGAACSVVLSEASILAMLLTALKKQLFDLQPHRVAWRPITACLGAASVMYVSRHSVPMMVILFVASYLAILFTLRTFQTEDWRNLKSLFSQE
jgi:O-antigen/teichoic acid export membrane protein